MIFGYEFTRTLNVIFVQNLRKRNSDVFPRGDDSFDAFRLRSQLIHALRRDHCQAEYPRQTNESGLVARNAIAEGQAELRARAAKERERERKQDAQKEESLSVGL